LLAKLLQYFVVYLFQIWTRLPVESRSCLNFEQLNRGPYYVQGGLELFKNVVCTDTLSSFSTWIRCLVDWITHSS
jgi:hypothetical protein